MAQAVTAMIPLQVLTPPVLTPPRMVEESSGQIGKLAPTAFNEYVRDFWQRLVLFLGILRQIGNLRGQGVQSERESAGSSGQQIKGLIQIHLCARAAVQT